MQYEPVIGLEVHAELQTRSKMFCACPVVDSVEAQPNTSVCPVCAGMPGVLPVVNRRAVEYGIRVALALGCKVAHTSLFDRKNYFYPDLPKGYQISQYEHPLAEYGHLVIHTSTAEKVVRIRRVHLEEDTGKLTHISKDGQSYSLVDLNRAGVPLLEIVSEPDLHSPEEVTAYAASLRAIVRALGVNSGDMEKGVIRFEANVSIRPLGSQTLGTRVEIKNLNSFRAMERAVIYEIARQSTLLNGGGRVKQETLGWDEANNCTVTQRSKEEAHDYRYFPEPDLPPLVVEATWIEEVRASLPELPQARLERFGKQYNLTLLDALQLAEETSAANFFELTVQAAPQVAPRTIANWITGEIFSWLNRNKSSFSALPILPVLFAELLNATERGEINLPTAKAVLSEMLSSGQSAGQIIAMRGLQQISDGNFIATLVAQVLAENPQEIASYLSGKENLANWFFGQVMRQAGGKANPAMLRDELKRQLHTLKR